MATEYDHLRRIAELEAELEDARMQVSKANDGYEYERQARILAMQQRDTARAEAERLRADMREFIRLNREQSIRSFVAGAAWWEWYKTKATMWASDKTLAWGIAEEKYPFAYVDHREEVDVVEQMREIADRYALAAPTQGTEAPQC